jgi:hypothetical protein
MNNKVNIGIIFIILKLTEFKSINAEIIFELFSCKKFLEHVSSSGRALVLLIKLVI